MTSKRASADLLDELHALQAATLIAEVRSYREHVDEDGNPAPLPVPPALLAQVTKFLKDNGIDSPSRGTALRDNLRGHLPDLEDVDEEQLGWPQ